MSPLLESDIENCVKDIADQRFTDSNSQSSALKYKDKASVMAFFTSEISYITCPLLNGISVFMYNCYGIWIEFSCAFGGPYSSHLSALCFEKFDKRLKLNSLL